jgi:NAD-dependent deacetylase
LGGDGGNVPDDATLEAAAGDLADAPEVVAFTGAGVSTESGIPDFRSPGGIWDTYDPSDFSWDAFQRDPAGYWELRGRLMEALDLESVDPNPAHFAIAALEAQDRLRSVVTQNIDGLHREAGHAPGNVLQVHGTAREVRCLGCDERFPYEVAQGDVEAGDLPPSCPECGGVLKPGTVLFGEQLPQDTFRRARKHARTCDHFLVVGSSLTVRPAADLPRIAAESGATLAIVNRDPTPLDAMADHVLQGEAGTVVPALVEAAGLDPEP